MDARIREHDGGRNAENSFTRLPWALEGIAKERGVSNMQVALAWVLKNPAITSPIIGTSKPHHLDDALGAFSIKLTDDEIKTLEKPYQPKPVLDHV